MKLDELSATDRKKVIAWAAGEFANAGLDINANWVVEVGERKTRRWNRKAQEFTERVQTIVTYEDHAHTSEFKQGDTVVKVAPPKQVVVSSKPPNLKSEKE